MYNISDITYIMKIRINFINVIIKNDIIYLQKIQIKIKQIHGYYNN